MKSDKGLDDSEKGKDWGIAGHRSQENPGLKQTSNRLTEKPVRR
ncbi:MAG: hypothetical protein PHH63_01620 [Bacteroidales bacterium]|nr:hypothetical protein [Bacteroidales bacterium]MDD3161718.1 hypothetical protein [Bacteroidales bacterium]